MRFEKVVNTILRMLNKQDFYQEHLAVECTGSIQTENE